MARTQIEQCPVALLALEFDTLCRAYDRLDCEQTASSYPGCKQPMMDVTTFRKEAIKWEASYLLASSTMGAAFQIMLAGCVVDEISDDEGFAQRQHEAMADRLMRQAAKFLMKGERRINRAYQYCMGDTADPAYKLATLIGENAK